MNAQQLQTRLDYANKRCKFAWAKYYEEVRGELHNDHAYHDTFNRVADDKAIPEHIKVEMKAMATALKKKWECPVCIDMIADEQLEITNCGHYYCKDCLEAWKKTCKDRGDAKWKCGMCNRQHKFNE
jgi:hypothetical protein